MADEVNVIDAFDEAVEKARGKGLIRGGSYKLGHRIARFADKQRNRLGRDAKAGKPNRYVDARDAAKYLGGRSTQGSVYRGKKGGLRPLRLRTGIYKSVEALGEAIEKAGLRLGGVRVSPAQRRKLAMTSGGTHKPRTWNKPRSIATGVSQYRGSKQKPFSDPGARGPSGSTKVGEHTRSSVLRRALGYGKDPKGGGLTRREAKRHLATVRDNSRHAIERDRKRRGLAPKFKVGWGGRYKPISKAAAKTLYVYRPVLNAADIIAWAESQGFKSTQPAEKIHVTLAYSKTPLNWAMLHDDYHLEPTQSAMDCGCGPVCRSDDNSTQRKISGGVREVKALGADGAVVLAFESDSLTRRFMDFKSAGAVWKYPSFQAHLTFTYAGEGVDLSKVHPYAGDIVLGEEHWEEIDPNGQDAAIAAERKSVKKALDSIDARLAAVEQKQNAEAA